MQNTKVGPQSPVKMQNTGAKVNQTTSNFHKTAGSSLIAIPSWDLKTGRTNKFDALLHESRVEMQPSPWNGVLFDSVPSGTAR